MRQAEQTPSIAALIPARSGSKRLPGKNIRPLAGHPVIAYTTQNRHHMPTTLLKSICNTVIAISLRR